MRNVNRKNGSQWNNKIGTLQTRIEELEEEIKVTEDEIDKVDDKPKVNVKKEPVKAKAKKVKATKGKVQQKSKLAFQSPTNNENHSEIVKSQDCVEITVSTLEDRTEELLECEVIIEKNLHSFVESGLALTRIKEEELFRPDDACFEHYLQRRWTDSNDWAKKLIKGAKIALHIDNCLSVKLNECQTRQLHTLHEDEKAQKIVVTKAVALAGADKLSYRHIREAVTNYLQKKGTPIKVKKVSVKVKTKSVSNQVSKFEDMTKKILKDYDAQEVKIIFDGKLKLLKSIIATIERAGE